MDDRCENIRIMAGFKFDESGCPYNLDYYSGQIIYIISIKEGAEKAEPARLHKFARISGYTFKIVLVDRGDGPGIGFAFFGEVDELDEMAGTMKWIVSLHNDWVLLDCREEMPRIVGVRIANNPFHAEKILLNGERLD